MKNGYKPGYFPMSYKFKEENEMIDSMLTAAKLTRCDIDMEDNYKKNKIAYVIIPADANKVIHILISMYKDKVTQKRIFDFVEVYYYDLDSSGVDKHDYVKNKKAVENLKRVLSWL